VCTSFSYRDKEVVGVFVRFRHFNYQNLLQFGFATPSKSKSIVIQK
jgi:hypothetical protein